MKILFILDYNTYKDNLVDIAHKASFYSDKIWFRIKNIDAITVLHLSKKLRDTLPNSTLILSDRADIAHLARFNGVHLGASSIPPEIIKNTFPNLTVGYSAHSLKELELVNADYYTLSPIFFTKKDYPVVPIGPIDVRNYNKKIYALGGINKENVSKLLNLGFHGIAGISFLDDLPDIKSLLNK